VEYSVGGDQHDAGRSPTSHGSSRMDNCSREPRSVVVFNVVVAGKSEWGTRFDR